MTRALMVVGAAVLAGTALLGQQRPAAASLDKARLEAAINKEVIDGDLKSAIALYRELTQSADRAVAAQSYLRLGQGYRRLGDPQAKPTLQRALEFTDQPQVVAKARAALGLRAQSGSGTASGPSMRRVWAGAGASRYGAVSLDGRFIAHVDPDTGDLAVRDVEAGTNRRITLNGNESWNEFAESHAFSPDGSQIAYAWYSTRRRYELRIVDAGATSVPAPRTLIDRPDIDWIAVTDWSRDGKWLAAKYSTHGGGVRLARISVADGSVEDLRAPIVAGPTRIVFSPDGRFVAYDMLRDNDADNRDIVVRSLTANTEWYVATAPGYDELVGWGPDGTTLAFASDRSGTHALWVVAVSEGKPIGAPRQAHGNVGDGTLGITSKGALFVGVVSAALDINVVAVDTATGKRLGEPSRPVPSRIGPGRGPVWSPDGSQLMFTLLGQRRLQGRTLAVRDMRTGHVRELQTSLRNLNFPRWSPEGRSVVVQGAHQDGRTGIFRIAVETGEVTPVALEADGAQYAWPSWSPDGQRVYFLRDTGGLTPFTIERDLTTGREREFADVRAGLASPDGRFLLASPFSGDRISELRLVPTAGGQSRVVYSVSEGGLPWANWTPDSKHILVRHTGKDRDDVLLIPIDGGAPKKLDLPGAQWGWMSMHPDGKRIAYLAGKQEEEVWVIENVLPASKASR
jgi:Tol biopolymer transport system component